MFSEAIQKKSFLKLSYSQTQQSKFVNWQVDGEYRGADFTAAVTLGNPDILVGSGEKIVSCSSFTGSSPTAAWNPLLHLPT